MQDCVVIGAGGHAKTVIDAILLQGQYRPVASTDRELANKGNVVLGVPVIGGDDQLPALLVQGVKHFAMGVGSASDNTLRKRLFERAIGAGLTPIVVAHPAALVAPSARLGRGSVVLAGGIINASANIGENVIVNTGTIVEHDCEVQDHVHLCPGVRLTGGVVVREGAFIGAGTVVKQRIRVAEWATIGMGSVVVKSVDAYSTVAGVPAKCVE